MIKTKEDLTGKKFGRLTVLRQVEDHVSKSGVLKAQWLCRCDCGKEVPVIGTNLKRGNSTSCGCYQQEVRLSNSITHGERHSRLYGIWTNMKTRTCHTGTKASAMYGDRGIGICDEWRNDFATFKDWALSHGYNDSLTIDRIDVDGDYCPENCRWADAVTQARNRRSSVYVEYDGVKRTLAEWADLLGYSRSIFHARAKLYHTSIEEQVHILAASADNK